MKVIPITPRGFCPGVVRAIKIVENVLKDKMYPLPIYVLGMIVHNKYVVKDLQAKGVITLDDPNLSRLELLDGISSGTIIVTAHGASNEVFQKINNQGLTLVDATCEDVYKTHTSIKKHLLLGYKVIFIGKNNHPETEAIMALDTSISLVETLNDVLNLPNFELPVFVANQTTFSIRDIEIIIEQLRIKYPMLIAEDEICNSTRVRQEAIIEGNKNVDLCYVVGDSRSNNTRNLVKTSIDATNTKTILIESVKDINPEDTAKILFAIAIGLLIQGLLKPKDTDWAGLAKKSLSMLLGS